MPMQDIIEKVKSQNGNANISQKDMLWYIVGKVDDLHDKLGNQVVDCHKTFLTRATYWKLTALLTTLFVTLVSSLAYFVFK